MNKRGITEDLPRLIAIVAGILVFLIIIMPPLWSMIKKGGETGKCDWNLLLAAGFKTGTLGFGEIPVGCQAEHVTANADTLQKTTRIAKKRINKYCGEQQAVGAAIFFGRATSQTSIFYAEAAQQFCKNDAPTYDTMNEWALDALIGKRMVECWNKVWHGKLNFFTKGVTDRNMCVACSVIRFSDDLPAYINNKQIISLYDWLNAERYYKTTYYDFLADGQTVKPTKEMLYYATDTPLAITFMHGKVGAWKRIAAGAGVGAVGGAVLPGVGAVAGAIVGGVVTTITTFVFGAGDDEDVKQVVLVPYESLRHLCTDIIA